MSNNANNANKANNIDLEIPGNGNAANSAIPHTSSAANNNNSDGNGNVANAALVPPVGNGNGNGNGNSNGNGNGNGSNANKIMASNGDIQEVEEEGNNNTSYFLFGLGAVAILVSIFLRGTIFGPTAFGVGGALIGVGLVIMSSEPDLMFTLTVAFVGGVASFILYALLLGFGDRDEGYGPASRRGYGDGYGRSNIGGGISRRGRR